MVEENGTSASCNDFIDIKYTPGFNNYLVDFQSKRKKVVVSGSPQVGDHCLDSSEPKFFG